MGSIRTLLRRHKTAEGVQGSGDRRKVFDLPVQHQLIEPAHGALLEVFGGAMGVECLLKALWLKRGGRFVENGRFVKVPHAGDQHDLPRLAAAAMSCT